MTKRKNDALNVKILLDRSGSMASMWSDAVGGISAYIKGLPENSLVTVKTFDSYNSWQGRGTFPSYGNRQMDYIMAYDTVFVGTAGQYNQSAFAPFNPRGGTPLLDATARIIEEALDDGKKKTVVVVMTDGHENSSQQWNYLGVSERIKRCQDKGWEVLFLGANFAGIVQEGSRIGLDASKYMDVKVANFVDAYSTLSNATVAYASGATRGINLTDDIKAAAQK